MRPARILLVIMILITSLGIALPMTGVPVASAAPLAQERVAIITSPRDGAQLTGVVQITGTATDPKFDHYELAWASQNTPDAWQMIANVQNQIQNGSLGTWDTASLPPGVYRLLLRVVRQGDKNTDAVVNNLSINQGTPTPAPTATPTLEVTIAPTPTLGAAAATPTVVIVQPPTSTPQAVATGQPAAGSSSSTGGPRTPSVQVNFASFGQAFCNGALYTLLIFIVWGIIWAMREIARWALKRFRTSTTPKG